MTDLRRPQVGGRVIIRSSYVERLPLEDPLDGATDEEREFYLAHYQGVPLVELLRRLRTAEWDAAHYRREAEVLREYDRRMPPLHVIRALAERHKRVRALLDVPRRRTIPKAELAEALLGRLDDTA